MLVVEDEARMARLLKRGLEEEGHAVDVAGDGPEGLWLATENSYAAVVLDVVLATLAILKGKPLLGLIGIFIWVTSLVGVLRLAAPDSPWARRFYDPDGHKLARSRARWERIRARRRRVTDAIAGAPESVGDSAAAVPPEKEASPASVRET